jgi:hypothetical protein
VGGVDGEVGLVGLVSEWGEEARECSFIEEDSMEWVGLISELEWGEGEECSFIEEDGEECSFIEDGEECSFIEEDGEECSFIEDGEECSFIEEHSIVHRSYCLNLISFIFLPTIKLLCIIAGPDKVPFLSFFSYLFD